MSVFMHIEDVGTRFQHYQNALASFAPRFMNSYVRTKSIAKFLEELPLTEFGWQLSLVEAARFYVLISRKPNLPPTSRQGFMYQQHEYPGLAGLQDQFEIAKVLRLGQVISMREFTQFIDPPWQGSSEVQRNEYRQGSGEYVVITETIYTFLEYVEDLCLWAEEWAETLAKEHMAQTHPDFETAKRRMAG